MADEQTAGQGRLGRDWHSERGAGLYMTQVLRLKRCPDSLPLVTLALGLATAEAITRLAECRSGSALAKRCSDLDGRKCAGILVQLTMAC